jgi:hypothetical protein
MTSNEPFRSSTSIFQPKKNKRVFERFDPAYSILARTLTARRDNLIVTVADLGQRLRAITAAIPVAIPEAASTRQVDCRYEVGCPATVGLRRAEISESAGCMLLLDRFAAGWLDARNYPCNVGGWNDPVGDHHRLF